MPLVFATIKTILTINQKLKQLRIKLVMKYTGIQKNGMNLHLMNGKKTLNI